MSCSKNISLSVITSHWSPFVSVQLIKVKVSLYRPGQGSKRLRPPEFVDSRNMKVVRL